MTPEQRDTIRYVKGTPNWDFLTRPNGTSWPSRCEFCGKNLTEHNWVDLDAGGFIVACSERQQPEGGTDDHSSE